MTIRSTSSREHSSVDVVNLTLGVGLALLPWAASHNDTTTIWSGAIAGLLIALVAAGGLFANARWEKWASVLLGAWTVAAPWALGFAEGTIATYAHVIVGTAVAVLAAAELFALGRPAPATRAAPRLG